MIVKSRGGQTSEVGDLPHPLALALGICLVRIFFGHEGRGFFALFGANTSDFSKLMACPHRQGK